MATTKVSSKDAVALLKEMDVKSVSKDTPPDELAKKLKKFVKAAGDSLDTGDKHLNHVFKELAKAYEDGDTVKVLGGASKAEGNGHAGKKGKPKDEDDEDDTEDMDEDEDEDENEDEDDDEPKKKGGKKVKTKDKKKNKTRANGSERLDAIASALTKTPMSPKEIKEAADLGDMPIFSYLKRLVESGRAKSPSVGKYVKGKK